VKVIKGVRRRHRRRRRRLAIANVDRIGIRIPNEIHCEEKTHTYARIIIYTIIIMYIISAHLHERGAARVLVMDYCLHFGRR